MTKKMEFYELLRTPNQDNFTFILPCGEFNVTRLFADFLSPVVESLHEFDPEKDFLEIQVKCKQETFEKILGLAEGMECTFTSDEYKEVYEILLSLGNEELYNKFVPNFKEPISVKNVQNRILFKIIMNRDFSREIYFLASNYPELDHDLTFDLPFEAVYAVLSSDEIKNCMKNNITRDIIKHKNKFSKEQILKLVELGNGISPLSDQLPDYFELVKEFGLTEKIFQKTRTLFWLSAFFFEGDTKENEEEKEKDDEVPKEPPEAIIKKLRTENSSQRRAFAAASSKTQFEPSVVIENDMTKQWVSNDAKEQWLLIHFMNCKIQLSSYEITTHDGPSFPRSWKVEGNDSHEYILLDTVTNSDKLVWPNRTASFDVKNKSVELNAIKFTMTGKSSEGDNIFCIRHIELYGKLIRK